MTDIQSEILSYFGTSDTIWPDTTERAITPEMSALCSK